MRILVACQPLSTIANAYLAINPHHPREWCFVAGVMQALVFPCESFAQQAIDQIAARFPSLATDLRIIDADRPEPHELHAMNTGYGACV